MAGWRRAFQALKKYIALNELEAEGLISRSQAGKLGKLRQADDG